MKAAGFPAGPRKAPAIQNRPRILHLHCGGTAGMPGRPVPSDLVTLLKQKGNSVAHLEKPIPLKPTLTGKQIIAASPTLRRLRKYVDIVSKDVYRKDSSEVGILEWERLIAAIEKNKGKYDAIMVTHGTDRLSPTAKAVSYAYGKNPDFFCAFSGSMSPSGELGGDQIVNLERTALAAISAAAEGRKGVVLCFNDRIEDPHHVSKVGVKGFDAFRSPGHPGLGRFTSEGVEWFNKVPEDQPSRQPFLPYFEPGVIRLDIDKETDPRDLETAINILRLGIKHKNPGAVIFEGVGTNNIPTSHLRVLAYARTHGVPIILTSKSSEGETFGTRYTQGQAALERGVITAHDMTREDVKVKLHWLLGNAKILMDRGKLEKEDLTAFIAQGFNHVRVSEAHIERPERLPLRLAHVDGNLEPELALGPDQLRFNFGDGTRSRNARPATRRKPGPTSHK